MTDCPQRGHVEVHVTPFHFRKSTRSTGTVHTSAKARLTSVTIRIRIHFRIRDPDWHQNLTICSSVHCQPSPKISFKSGQKFLRKVANRQTDRQTTTIRPYISPLAEVIIFWKRHTIQLHAVQAVLSR